MKEIDKNINCIDAENIDFSEIAGQVDLPEKNDVDMEMIAADMQDWRDSR